MQVARLDQANINDQNQRHGAAGAANARTEAVNSFDKFDRSAMAPKFDTGLPDFSLDGHATPVAFKPAPLAGKTDVGNGEIKPKDPERFHTPVIPGPVFPDDRPVDEHGNHTKDTVGPNPDLPDDKAKSVVGRDGKLSSVTTTNPGHKDTETTSFTFNKNGTITRKVEDHKNNPDGSAIPASSTTETTIFDKNGKPLSRTETKPGSSKQDKVPVDPDDKLTVQRDKKGNVTSLVSEDGKDYETKLEFDAKGNVTSRTINNGDLERVTQFDGGGQTKYDKTTDFDKDGNKTKTSIVTPDETREQTFDKQGNVTKDEWWSGHEGTHTSNEKLPDGTTVSKADSDGVQSMVVNRPDGTRMRIQNDGIATQLKIEYPDGSTFESSEDAHQYFNKRTDKDGYWQYTMMFNKHNGIVTKFSGGPNQQPPDGFGDRQTSEPI